MLGRAPPPSVIRLTPDQVASSTAFGQHRTLANFFGGRAVPCLAVKSSKGNDDNDASGEEQWGLQDISVRNARRPSSGRRGDLDLQSSGAVGAWELSSQGTLCQTVGAVGSRAAMHRGCAVDARRSFGLQCTLVEQW